jgi:hypothetical protein
VTVTIAQVSAAAAAYRTSESLEIQRVAALPARVGRTLSSCRSRRAPLLPLAQLLHAVLIQRHAARLIEMTIVSAPRNTMSGFQIAANAATGRPIT